jgi:putative transcriptional regulator
MKNRIKELRARENLTQGDLAEKVGATRQTILYIERGEYNPSLMLALKICKELKSKVEEVFIVQEEDLK